ncbi:porin [Terrihabitans soli]|uniref:Porin n=1 Tax=Terrihabitans soli TaxID=708113 RepID=A0A6S6QU38_9HYPH|nr:porin [Terrihabitans soli]BCJ90470.1 porin [Terrihabitans soli]
MKTVKSLLLGSAAGFVALTGAQAADLPLAEPVEYVKVCSTYGEGFFYIPGTDTCLQISGRVRVEGYISFYDSDTGLAGSAEENDFETRARGVIGLDARTETEWGTLRSYIEYEANSDSEEYNYDDAGFEVENVASFIQFAGITAGKAPSFYDYAETSTWADFWSSEDVWTVAYTASFGSGFSATIGIEDKYYRANPYGYTVGSDSFGLDQVWPNVIAALRVDQAWGSAQLSAAVQDNQGDTEDYTTFYPDVEDELGWGVQLGAKFNLPIAEEGSYFLIQGAYSEGALSYAGGEEDFTDFSPGISDQSFNAAGDLENNTLLSVGASVGIQASETVALALTGAYYDYDSAAPGDAGDFDGFLVEGNVVWTPVDNLDLGLYAIYGSFEDEADTEFEDLRVITRLQRDF